MPGLVPGIHVFLEMLQQARRGWPGAQTSTWSAQGRLLCPAMTTFVVLYLIHKTWQIDRPIKKPGIRPNAVSNHDRRLLAEAGMAGRTQHAVGAMEIKGGRDGAG